MKEQRKTALADRLVLPKSLVIIGMPGSGKTTIGRTLAVWLGLPFVDSDHEIEVAANMTVPQIFERHGEAHFRQGERKVIARLLNDSKQVLSTGGGAFMDEQTRRLIKTEALSLWLKADIEVLFKRTAPHAASRPLFKGKDVREVLSALKEAREPVYAQADLTVMTDDSPVSETVERVLASLKKYVAENFGAQPRPNP